MSKKLSDEDVGMFLRVSFSLPIHESKQPRQESLSKYVNLNVDSLK